MSLVDNNGNGGLSAADVAAVCGCNNNGWGNGWGGDGWWVILFLFALMGNNGWGGFGGGFGNDGAVPYLYNSQTQNDVNRGFDTLALSNQIQDVQNSVQEQGTRSQLSDIGTSINNGFANAEVANCNRAMSAMQTAYNNQIADMNQRFTLATAVDDRIDNLSMALQKCLTKISEKVAGIFNFTVGTCAA